MAPAGEDTAAKKSQALKHIDENADDGSGTVEEAPPVNEGKGAQARGVNDYELDGLTCRETLTVVNGHTIHEFKCTKCFVTGPIGPPQCESVVCDAWGFDCQPDTAHEVDPNTGSSGGVTDPHGDQKDPSTGTVTTSP